MGTLSQVFAFQITLIWLLTSRAGALQLAPISGNDVVSQVITYSISSPDSMTCNKRSLNASTTTPQLLHLATFTDDPNPAVTRIVFTENDLLARG